MNKHNENIAKYAEADLIITEVNCVFNQHMSSNWKHNPDTNPFHRLVFVFDGEYTAYVNDQAFHVQTNDVLFVPRDARYRSSSISENFGHTTILFDYDQKSSDSYLFDYLYHAKSPEKFKQLFYDILQIWMCKNFGYKLKTKMILYSIFRTLLMERMLLNNVLHSYNTIQHAVNYIDKNYDKDFINMDDLAKLAGITPTHFTRLFKEVYQTTPVKYINKLRIDRAAELLEHSTLSVTEISDQLGFSDPSYFSKLFKRLTGESPLHFRQIR